MRKNKFDDKEKWVVLDFRDIYTDTYLISSHGRIKFIKDNKYVNLHRYGDKKYVVVSLKTSSGHNKTFGVHTLVAHTFVSGYNELTGKVIVNHKNSDRACNHYKNLEWVTYWDNTKHGIIYGNIEGTTYNGNKIIYSEEFIHTICEYIRDGVKTKYILTFLHIPKEIHSPIKALIKDIRNKRTHKDISDKYGITHKTRNLFPITEVHKICDLLSKNKTIDEIFEILEVPEDKKSVYRKIIFNIEHKYSFVKISDSYNIPKKDRVTRKISTELIEDICKCLENGMRASDIIELLNLNNDDIIKNKKLISDIKSKRYYTKISSKYKW